MAGSLPPGLCRRRLQCGRRSCGGLLIFFLFALLFEALFGPFTGRVRSSGKAGLALLIAPLAGFIVGSLYGWNFDSREFYDRIKQALDRASVFDRAWIAWAAMWSTIAVVGMNFMDLVSPIPLTRWSRDEFSRALLFWLAPIFGGWSTTKLVQWVLKGAR
ncbi:MAG: hypothetical protein KGP27_10965 [Hyphomicrobiales bacterium]|nr:hypothetical protein [Hyphomicrobiales bacterium]